ncbi:hypothetical protein AMTR_s00110p00015050, partial [Amborella trichopoda]
GLAAHAAMRASACCHVPQFVAARTCGTAVPSGAKTVIAPKGIPTPTNVYARIPTTIPHQIVRLQALLLKGLKAS